MQQIKFNFDTQYGPLSDVIYLKDDHGLTEEQIESMKQERLDSWLAILIAADNGTTEVDPSIDAEIEYTPEG